MALVSGLDYVFAWLALNVFGSPAS
jgi:hypothetical protein